MDARVLSWTRVERPPAGFAPGRVIVLVDAAGEHRYALWDRVGEPTVAGAVRLERRGDTWVAR